MGFLDRLFGRSEEPEQPQRQTPQYSSSQYGSQQYGSQQYNPPPGQPQQLTDAQAIERYRYMLRTAPPETIEQAHEEAFAQLTPEQRRMVLQQLLSEMPEHERRSGAYNQDDPRTLARMATRAEVRQPGTLERTFSGMQGAGVGGIGLGGLMAGSFLSSFAGVILGSMIAQQFFAHSDYGAGSDAGNEAGAGEGGDQQTGEPGAEGDQGAGDYAGQDAGYGDAGYADTGGYADTADMGDFGGDFGGGDFGGGDFGV